MDLPDGKFSTILADPPWKFDNKTGKVAPEHKRLYRYQTMTNEDIINLPVQDILNPTAHLYLWVPNALVSLGLQVMATWGFTYKTNLIWYKVRKDGGPDRRGVGFYFRNVTEIVLFGVKGRMRTLQPGRTMPNIIISMKREHSRKPDQLYSIIEKCSPEPYLELFNRVPRNGWTCWGDQTGSYEPKASIYTKHSEQPGLFERADPPYGEEEMPNENMEADKNRQ
ncbi:MAG: MT-A70 family methyltransferase [Anaerolineales bacterium]|nr:MT-A70 family methyltransferase [Anaerolineales bacterium]